MPLPPNKAPWTSRDAAHLLTRAGFGATAGEIANAHAGGLDATVARLLKLEPESKSFVDTTALLRRAALSADSIEGLKAWWFYRMASTANPLLEKMSLFWHNHFATSWAKVQSAEAMAAQNKLIREQAIGSFRKLADGMTRDVAMLEWLDANSNRKRHANENFARELMELFTLGVGNYTERDIKEAARAFTGWHVRRGEFWFHKAQHDTGSKSVFGKSGPLGADEVVRLCLEQKACPRFLATKLLKSFVCRLPDPALIDAFAATIREHDFEMAPALGELFRSAAFFAPENRAAIIKSPAELVAGTARTLGLRAKLPECTRLMAELGQNLFEPPTVKGWEGGRLWINSASLLQRANFAAEIASGSRYGTLTADLPNESKALAELLLAVPAPAAALASAKKQSTPSRLQLFMSLPEYQLL